MPVPNHPDKHGAPAVITPRASADHFSDDLDPVPERLVLCYDDGLLEHVRTDLDATPFDTPWGEGFALDSTAGRVGVVGGFGVGAPVTALAMEALVVRGAEQFVAVGHAGSLQPAVGVGDLVVVDRALRDDGTSHHYLEPGRYVDASPSLRERLTATLEDRGEPYSVGSTWTIDAAYRETVPEVETYREEGVVTVDMEAAAAFAVADHRDVAAGALFTISDHLDTDGWEPAFGETQEHLERALAVAVDALTPSAPSSGR